MILGARVRRTYIQYIKNDTARRLLLYYYTIYARRQRDVKFKKKNKSRYSVFNQTQHKLSLIDDRFEKFYADEIRKRVLNIHFIKSG